MIYTIKIIGIPPHTTILYKIEILKSIVYYLNVSLKKKLLIAGKANWIQGELFVLHEGGVHDALPIFVGECVVILIDRSWVMHYMVEFFNISHMDRTQI